MGGGINPPPEVLREWAKIGNPADPKEMRGWEVAILSIVLFTLTLIVVIARLWARMKVRAAAGIDDILIMIAMIPTAGLAIATVLGSRLYGFDRHAYDLTPTLAVQSRQITLVMLGTYITSTGLTKISILLFYRRMSDGAVSGKFRSIVIGSIVFVVLYMVTFLINLFISCRPFHAYWDQVNHSGWALTHKQGRDYHCIDEGANLKAASIVSITQDFLACGLPMLLFWKLQLPRRQKIALGAIFGVGFFLCITGILRTIYTHKVFYQTYDVTWAAQDAWVWTVVESNVAIICASAPALKIFFKQYFKVRSLTGSLTRTFKQREYTRWGQKSISYSAQDTALTGTGTLDGTSDDVELRGVTGIMKGTEVDTYSVRSEHIDGEKSGGSTASEEQQIQGSTPYIHSMHQSSGARNSTSAPWMFIDPPAPSRTSRQSRKF